MLRRLRVSRSRFNAEEDTVLAEAVENVQTAADPLTPDERIVYDGDQYLGGIMMDGHLLTFCNNGFERTREMGEALDRLGANQERALFDSALQLWKQHGCVDFSEADETTQAAFADLDGQFFTMAGETDSLEQRTRQYVREHADSFIVLE